MNDRRDDGWVLLAISGAVLAAFSIGAAAQTVFVFRSERVDISEILDGVPDLGIRLLANLSAVAVALLCAAAVRLHERRGLVRMANVAAIALVAALLRYGLQLLLGIYDAPVLQTFAAEVSTVFLAIAISLLLGLAQSDAIARLRKQERASARQRLRAVAALEALTGEELRVRREVAEGLHGTVQSRLVMVGIRFDSVLERFRSVQREEADHLGWSDADILELTALRHDIDDIREKDVREMSQLLYPAGVEFGIAHAVRLLVQRIPPTIQAEMVIDDRIAALGDDRVGIDRRVLLVRAAEEAITNALRHGSAARLRVELAVESGATDRSATIRLSVDDDGAGTGLGSTAPAWHGLARLSERAGAFGGELTLDASDLGGARLTLIMPTLQPSHAG